MYTEIKFPRKDIPYYCFWILLFAGLGTGGHPSMPSFQRVIYVALIFAFIKLLITKWDFKSLAICVLLNGLGLLIFLVSKSPGALLTTIGITAAKDVDLKRIFKLGVFLMGALYITKTTFAITGIIENNSAVSYDEIIPRLRYWLGYTHPNMAQLMLFIVLVMVCVVYSSRLKLWQYILMGGYTYYIYTYTNSRTGFIMSMVLLVSVYITTKSRGKGLNRALRLGIEKIYILSAIVAYIFCSIYSNNSFLAGHGNLSSRFQTGSVVVRSYGLNLLGAPNVGTDCGIIQNLYAYGIILFVLMLLAETVLLKKIIQNKLYTEAVILIIYAIYMVIESVSSSILFNPLYLLLCFIIYPTSLSIYDKSRLERKTTDEKSVILS